jgi:hypothetical protein
MLYLPVQFFVQRSILIVSHRSENPVAPARQTQNRRKSFLARGFLPGFVSDEWIVSKQVLIDPVFWITWTGNVSMNVRRIAAVRIRAGFDGAEFVSAFCIRAHHTVNARRAIVAPVFFFIVPPIAN